MLVSWEMLINSVRIAFCAYCSKLLIDSNATRDHILPRCRNGTALHQVGVRNIRYCCAHCNELRGLTAHCPAAMACVRAVASKSGDINHRYEFRLAARWGFGAGSARRRIGHGLHRRIGAPSPKLAELWPSTAR